MSVKKKDTKKESDMIKEKIINNIDSLSNRDRLKVIKYAKSLSNRPVD